MSSSTFDQQPRSRENTLVIIMFFAAGIVFLDRFGITYLFPQISQELGLNNSQLAALVSVTAVAWAVSSLLFSVISDRFGQRKWIIIGSIVLFSITIVFVGFATNFWIMLLLRALIGLFEGPALPLIQSAVSAASTPSRRGRNLGIVIAGTAVIGAALAPSIMIGLAGAFGWRAAFPVVAIPGFLIAVLIAVFYQEDRAAKAADAVSLKEFVVVLRNRNVLLAVIGTSLLIGYTIGLGAFTTQYLSVKGLSAGSVTLVLTLFGIGGALGNIVAPTLSDRIGRKPALVIALVCAALIPVSFLVFIGTVPLLAASMLIGVMGGGALTIMTYVVPGESVPTAFVATAFAVQLAVGETIGGALGPQIGGLIADVTGNLDSTMIFYAALPTAAIAIALALKETAPRRLGVPAVDDDARATPTVVP